MAANDRSLSYGRYQLKLMPSGQAWRGAAYRGDVMIGTILAEPSREGIIAALKLQVDETERLHAEARERDGFPGPAEVHLALKQITISKGQDAMLHAHLRAPDMCLTATELAAAAGSDHYETANSQYGKLGKKLAEELEWSPPTYDEQTIWTFALATGVDDAGNPITEAGPASQQWRWRLRPQVAEAVRMLTSH